MTVYEEAIAKINQLPEPLVQEVRDFIELLQLRRNSEPSSLSTQFAEIAQLSSSDFSDYLSNLEDYEERLARGEIQW